jgi:large subunit ribosomal protein L10
MSKPVKEMIAHDLASRYADASNAVWIELVGVDGITTNAFRRDLRAKDMHLEVVKTALLKQACAAGPLAKLAAALSGPVALVTGGESAVTVAKVLDEWLPKLPKNLRVRGAVLDGEYLDESRCKDLSRMPTKADLQARIAQIILTPGGNIVAAALAGGQNIGGILKALIEKLEKAEAAAPAPASEPEPTPGPEPVAGPAPTPA